MQAMRVKFSYATAVLLRKRRVTHACLTLPSTQLLLQQLAHKIGLEHRLSSAMNHLSSVTVLLTSFGCWRGAGGGPSAGVWQWPG